MKRVNRFPARREKNQVEVGTSLLDAAKRARVKLECICGGETMCGKCRGIIVLNLGLFFLRLLVIDLFRTDNSSLFSLNLSTRLQDSRQASFASFQFLRHFPQS